MAPVRLLAPKADMNTGHAVRLATILTLLAVHLLTVSCASFKSYRPVTVDAISDPTVPAAQSYRIILKRPTPGQEAAVQNMAIAVAHVALTSKGMYEAVPNAVPDILIEVDYGLGNSIPLPDGPPVIEKFIQLSGRLYREDASPRGRGEEIWNVRASIAEPGMNIAGTLPIIAAVAAEYIASDTGGEQTIKVTEDSPLVARFRSTIGKSPAKTAP